MPALIIFDLETTGLSPANNEMIQIAAVRLQPGTWEIGDSFDSFIRPRAPVPYHITALTGISQRHVENAPGEHEALLRFSRFVGPDAMLVAHNGRRFDIPFIRHACLRQQLPVRETDVLDSCDLSRKIWGGRGGHGLDAVLSRLGISGQGVRRHDARGDVHLLAKAVHKMWHHLAPHSPICPVIKSTGHLPHLP